MPKIPLCKSIRSTHLRHGVGNTSQITSSTDQVIEAHQMNMIS
jgi:hypothetical protein